MDIPPVLGIYAAQSLVLLSTSGMGFLPKFFSVFGFVGYWTITLSQAKEV